METIDGMMEIMARRSGSKGTSVWGTYAPDHQGQGELGPTESKKSMMCAHSFTCHPFVNNQPPSYHQDTAKLNHPSCF